MAIMRPPFFSPQADSALPPLDPVTPPDRPDVAPVGDPLQTVIGALLLSQMGGPQALQLGLEQRERAQQHAEREAALEFEGALESAKFRAGEQERGERTRLARGAEAREVAGEQRAAAKFASEQEELDYRKSRRGFEEQAANFALDKARRELKLAEAQGNREVAQHKLLVINQLEGIVQRAQATAMEQIKLGAGAGVGRKLSALDAKKLLDPVQYGEYLALRAAGKTDEANAYLAQNAQAQTAALQQAFGASGITTTGYIKRYTELVSQDPIFKLVAKEMNVDPKSLINPAFMPKFMADFPPETQAAYQRLNLALFPVMKTMIGTEEQQAAIAVALRTIGLTDPNLALADKLSDAIALEWEIQHGFPREQSLQTLAELVADMADNDEIDWAIAPTEAEVTETVKAKRVKAKAEGREFSKKHLAALEEYYQRKRK